MEPNEPDQGRGVYLVLRDLLAGVVLLALSAGSAELGLPSGGAVTGVGLWLSAASAYLVYRAAMYIRYGAVYPPDSMRRPALRLRWRSLSKARPKAPRARTAS